MSRQEAELNLKSSPSNSSPSRRHHVPIHRGASRIAHRSWRRSIVAVARAAAVIAVCVAIKVIGGRTEADAQSSNRPPKSRPPAPPCTTSERPDAGSAAGPGMPLGLPWSTVRRFSGRSWPTML